MRTAKALVKRYLPRLDELRTKKAAPSTKPKIDEGQWLPFGEGYQLAGSQPELVKTAFATEFAASWPVNDLEPTKSVHAPHQEPASPDTTDIGNVPEFLVRKPAGAVEEEQALVRAAAD
jgi:hypothetical protein